MASEGATFELERFAWAAPDRLELSGRFIGLPDVSADAPVLVIVGDDRVHRLPAVPDSLAGPPEEGRRWRAAFAWQGPPVAFDVAELQLGSDLVVELPEPQPRRARFRRGMRGAAGHLGAELREAQELIEAKDAELDALRERVAMLQRALQDAAQLRAQLAQTRSTVEEARSDAERLLGRLSAFSERPETAREGGLAADQASPTPARTETV